MSLDDFFDTVETAKKTVKEVAPPVESPPEKTDDRASIEVPKDLHHSTVYEPGQDIDNIILLDSKYNGQLNVAQLVFYHPQSQSLYRWNDNTGHLPYLITMMSEEGVNSISPVVNSSNFVRMEKITKFYPLEQQEMELLRVYGNNPLAIGGKNDSFREYIEPSFEADIRYHHNYLADRSLTPGTYYRVKGGNLEPIPQDIGDIKQELEREFADEHPEELKMLDEYMPLLFQEIPDILRCAFDIEVGSDEGRLPNPSKADDPIISIALVDTEGRRICWVLNRPEVDQPGNFDDVTLLRYDSEQELLINFFQVVNQYPMALSFNGDNFDCPYLITRARKVGVPEDDILLRKGRIDSYFDDALHIDLYLFFRQASIRIYAFSAKYDSASLDELSSTLLGEGKLPHPDVWIDKMDLATLVKYNVKDAELTLRLTQFDDDVVINLIFILMRISKMPIFDFTRTAVSGWLKSWLIFEHRKRNYLIPRKEDILSAKGRTATSAAIIDGKKFQGAIVLDPKPGIWWDVHVLDFASLYPSIIKTRNLSYETILCSHDECKSNIVPEVGHYSCTKQIGLFAIVLGFVRDTRVKWFKPRSSDPSLSDMERRNNDVIQSSLKVLINAGYGVFGSEAFDFYCPPVAESTTAYARDAIMSTKHYVEETLGVDVLYGDTDSVFLYQPKPEQIEQLLEWGLQHVGVELGTDYEFRYVVFSDRKKNYFGITKSGYTIVKGLMGKKSNTPKIVRDHFDLVLTHLKNVQTPEEFPAAREAIVTSLRSMVSKLESGSFTASDISIRLSLSKRLKEYTTWTQTVQVAAQLLGTDHYPDDISIGSSLEFIKVKNPYQIVIPNSDKLAFTPGEVQKVSVKPVELVDPENDLDGQPVIDIAESTFSHILSSMGTSWNEVMGIKSLDDFF
ncbi:MAG: DNA-directed DNA polymerase I [Candidatus Kariarchaeaceae archaeon]|jgi:DNA polymerase I